MTFYFKSWPKLQLQNQKEETASSSAAAPYRKEYPQEQEVAPSAFWVIVIDSAAGSSN